MSYEYGFFNAVKQYDPSTGVLIGYDRVYDNESFVKYFKGLISDYGVFRTVSDRFEVTVPANRRESDADSKMSITICPGKAMVNGRWIVNSGYETLVVPPAEAALVRKDMVVIRWNETKRVMEFAVVKGTPSPYNRETDEISVLNCVVPLPYGFVWDEVNKSGHWDIDNLPDPDKAEIAIAYVVVRPGITSISADDIILNTGSPTCPWISRLAVNPTGADERDIDNYLAWYRGQLDSWFVDLLKEKDGTIVYLNRQEKLYPGGTALPLRLSKLDWFVLDVVTDTFNVYLNGRRLAKNVDFTIASDNDSGAIISFLNITNSVLPSSNEILVQVLKGESLPLRADIND